MLKELKNEGLNENLVVKDSLTQSSNKIYSSVIECSKDFFKRKKFFQQIKLNNIKAVKMILKYDNKLLYAYCSRGQTGLMKACEIGSIKMVELLIDMELMTLLI